MLGLAGIPCRHQMARKSQIGRIPKSIVLNWNYERGYVDLTMPHYIAKAIAKLQYNPSDIPEYAPHEFIPIKFSKKGDIQYTQKEDKTSFLDKKETLWVQSAVGSLLYYARALDSTIKTLLICNCTFSK